MSLPQIWPPPPHTAPFPAMQANPSYTAVQARQTLQRPAPEQEKPQKVQKQGFSADVRDYVQRAFAVENQVPGVDRATMQERLRIVISAVGNSGSLDDIDWRTYPLPQVMIQAERAQAAAAYGAQGAMLANMNGFMPYPMDGAYSPDAQNRKRKNGEVETTEAEQLATTPPWKKKNIKGASMEDRISGKGKNQKKNQKKSDTFRANAVGADLDVLEKRRQRFGRITPDPSPYLSSRDESPDAVSAGPLVGTCQTLEKKYFRLTAPPHPSTVRPLPVLEQALNHIRTKWKQDHNYSYACDQLKSMRQDLTVQHIQNELTVKVYEAHARIALEMKDLGEYNQCQTQLRALYKLNLPGKAEEFTAYRILYIIYTCNRTDMNDVLADLTLADKQKPGVKHALAVRSALASGNYHKFFRLYLDTPFMGGYLLDMIIQRERLAAMAAICKAYIPDVGLSFLAEELAFNGENGDEDESSDPDAGPRRCLDFLCQHGGESFVERKGDGETRFNTRKATAVFEGAKAVAFRGVDIKGQI